MKITLNVRVSTDNPKANEQISGLRLTICGLLREEGFTITDTFGNDCLEAQLEIPDSDLKDEFKGEPAQRDLFDIPIEGLNGGLP